MANFHLECFLNNNCLFSKTQKVATKSKSSTACGMLSEKRFWLQEFPSAVFLNFRKAYGMLWTKGFLFNQGYHVLSRFER